MKFLALIDAGTIWRSVENLYTTLFCQPDMVCLPHVILAMVLGIFLGMERHRKHKTAGVRTMMVISGAAALITSLGVEMCRQAGESDATRIAASLLQSVGFIGAGVILTRGIVTQGVTTAATILFAVGVGEACGFGMFGLAICGTILMIVGLLISERIFGTAHEYCNPLTISCLIEDEKEVRSLFGTNCQIYGFQKQNGVIEICIQPNMKVRQYEDLVAQLIQHQRVLSVHAEDIK